MSSALTTLETSRLRLDRLRPDDAAEMVGVLSDPGLYAYTGGEPPTQAQLRSRYEFQSAGASPDGTQDWLNWIVRTIQPHQAIGYTQATVDRTAATAELAWVIGLPWQGNGYAVEAVATMVQALRGAGVQRLIAHIHPEHVASQRIASHAGMVATDRQVDGETEWESVG